MDDLISRQKAIDVIKETMEEMRKNGTVHASFVQVNGEMIIFGLEMALNMLQSLPSAQPEIVRCKDCKFWKKYGYINGKPEFLPKCGFNQIYTSKDDFCSRAERKNNG